MTGNALLLPVLLVAALPSRGSDAVPEPARLQLTALTGDIQVRYPDWAAHPEGAPELPSVAAPSEVTVLAGQASFEVDLHAWILGRAGDRFALSPYAQGRHAGLRVDALGERSSLRIDVAGAELLLRAGSGVAIFPGGRVEVLRPPVELASGSRLREGESLRVSLTGGALLGPGDGLALRVPEQRGFIQSAMSRERLGTQGSAGQGARVTRASLAPLPAVALASERADATAPEPDLRMAPAAPGGRPLGLAPGGRDAGRGLFPVPKTPRKPKSMLGAWEDSWYDFGLAFAAIALVAAYLWSSRDRDSS